MLAKVPAKRNDGRSSFKSLQAYMVSRDVIDPETGEVAEWLLGGVPVETNCLDRETAWREMLAVADMNGRVKDPVYHVILSWPSHENPTDSQMFEASREAIKAVGMEGHQYCAAVHRDTNNAHVHLMINRVNPDTYKAVYPNRDHFKLDKCMREVELRQGWSHDNGPYVVHERDGKKDVDWAKESPKEYRMERRKEGPRMPTKARDMECHIGNESLISYTQAQPKKDALEALKNGGGWQALHVALGHHGLEIKPKGQGFAIYSKNDPEQTPIKASTMAAELGGGKLKKQLGEYQEPLAEIRREKPQREYNDQRPKRDPATREEQREARAAERHVLRDRYAAFLGEWKAEREPARKALDDSQKQRQRALLDEYKEQRATIRKSSLPAEHKKALYSVVAHQAAAKRAVLAEVIKTERKDFQRQSPSFRDWVHTRAAEGDPAAIRQLRGWTYQEKRKAKRLAKEDEEAARRPHLASAESEQQEPAQPRHLTDAVHWAVDLNTGDVDYQIAARTMFRDTGRRLNFTDEGAQSFEAIKAGLLLAREKFGRQPLQVFGSDEFRRMMLKAAVELRIDVRFADPDLEQERWRAKTIAGAESILAELAGKTSHKTEKKDMPSYFPKGEFDLPEDDEVPPLIRLEREAAEKQQNEQQQQRAAKEKNDAKAFFEQQRDSRQRQQQRTARQQVTQNRARDPGNRHDK